MFYRVNSGAFPIYRNCTGRLTDMSTLGRGYGYLLEWRTGDGHARGISEWKDAVSAAKGLTDYSFELLQCDPTAVLAFIACGCACDFEELEGERTVFVDPIR